MTRDRPPTQVCITVDTEFSIAGHFQRPDTWQPVAEPAVYGHVNGRDEGLGFMLETLARYDTAATFFIECGNYYYFGDEPMRTVLRRVQDAGRDVQLHVHPIWLYFMEGGGFPQHDDCAGRSFEELHRVFSLCIEVFERWAGHKPLAIRTGSLRADRNVYRVMNALGVPLSSNLALGVYEPAEPALRQHSGRHRIEGVMELPVFTYQDMKLGSRASRKSLQITSCSWPEMKALLRRARAAGVDNIVILTHPFEYIKKSDFRYQRLTRNRVNQQRLEKLCAFLRDHPEEFTAADFTGQQAHWRQSPLQHPYLEMPAYYALGRKLHNRVNDLIWSY